MIDMSTPAAGWMLRCNQAVGQANLRLQRARQGRALADDRANLQATKARSAASDIVFLEMDLEDTRAENAALRAEVAHLQALVGERVGA